MLSRVAENIYWMSRYLERTNFQLRGFQTRYVAYQDGVLTEPWEEFSKENEDEFNDKINLGEILSNAVFANSNQPSIANNVFQARENARSAQDHINKEVWQCLNDFHHLMNDENLQVQIKFGDPIGVYDLLIKQAMIYYGVINTSMVRDEGYCFLEFGKFIERVINTIRSIKKQWILSGDSLLDNDYSSWRYFLNSVSGYEFYLRNNSGVIEKEKIFHQMIYEENFPNSISYALIQIQKYSKKLKTYDLQDIHSDTEFYIGKSISNIQFTRHPSTNEEKLQFLTKIEKDIYELVHVINRTYFGLLV